MGRRLGARSSSGVGGAFSGNRIYKSGGVRRHVGSLGELPLDEFWGGWSHERFVPGEHAVTESKEDVEGLSLDNRSDGSTPAPRAPGIRLGSIWVSYVESYYEASKKLQPATPRLAYPILYLQRHTFELLTKEILSALLEIREQRDDLDILFGSLEGTGAVDPADVDVANSTHRFSDIFPCLERNLAVLGLPALPRPFHECRKAFDDVDDERPDRLRFETLFNKKHRTSQRSFPHDLDDKATYAPCDAIGSVLDQIVVARERQLENTVSTPHVPAGNELDNFYWKFWQACDDAEHDIVAALAPLVEATRKGELVWKWTSDPSLRVQEHPELKGLATTMFVQYLEANFRSRTFVLVVLRDLITVRSGSGTRNENGFYLAGRRVNGTLTTGVWPDHSQSNLLYEIQESFKKGRGA